MEPLAASDPAGTSRVASPAATIAALGAIAVVAAAGIASYLRRARGGSDVAAEAVRNASWIRAVESTLGVGWVGEQVASWGSGAAGAAAAGFYSVGYWPFLLLAVGCAFRADRTLFHRTWLAVAASGLVGLVIMAVLPVAPPRLAGGPDLVADHGLSGLAHPDGLVNPYAAMPSFHVAWTLVAALALGVAAPRLRGWTLVHPATMAVVVVATGDHYVSDVVAGAVLGAGAWWVAGTAWCAGLLPQPRSRAGAVPARCPSPTPTVRARPLSVRRSA